MTFVIAVAGKGGVGKSTVSALLVRVLADKTQSPILAVDADPNSNLGELLGTHVERTIGDIREDLLKQAEQSSGTSKHELVRYQVRMAMVEGEKFDLLTMGRPEGRGCYCYINNVLRTFLDEIMDDYPYVVIDNEAGMEHLSRRTCRRMDVLLVVSDPTKVGIESATRILNLAKSMEVEVRSSLLVINPACPGRHGQKRQEPDRTSSLRSDRFRPVQSRDRRVLHRGEASILTERLQQRSIVGEADIQRHGKDRLHLARFHRNVCMFLPS